MVHKKEANSIFLVLALVIVIAGFFSITDDSNVFHSLSSVYTGIKGSLSDVGNLITGAMIEVEDIIHILSGEGLAVSFIDPTPDDGNVSTNATFMVVNISAIASDLKELTFNWRGTNFTFYNDSLVLMYNFNNFSSLGENSTYVVDVKNGNNVSLINASLNTSGKYLGGLVFNGSGNDVRSVNNIGISGSSPRTAMAWFKSPKIGRQSIIAWGSGCYGTQFGLEVGFSGASQTIWGWGCGSDMDGVRTFAAGGWHHGTITYDGSTVRTYLDGVLDASQSLSWSTTNSRVRIGSDDEGNFFNGTIDEVMIWNRVLSVNEIQEIYMSNLYEYNPAQWYLYINQTHNATANLSGAIYTYQAFIKDTSNNANSTEQRTFTIPDTVLPVVSFTGSTPSNNSQGLFNYFTVEVSVTEDNPSNITYYLYNSSGLVNSTTYGMATSSSNTSHTFSNLTDGLYFHYNVTAIDYFGNSGNSQTRLVTINTSAATPPVITFLDPTPPDGTTSSNTSFIINASIEESSLANLTYTWNGTNYTLYDDSLVLMYNFNNKSELGESNSIVFDVSGNGNNGTPTLGAIPTVNGKYGGGISLDGSNDYVKTPSLSVSTNFAISAWIKIDTLNRRNIIFGAYGGYVFFLETSNRLTIWAGDGTSCGDALATGTWYHAAISTTNSNSHTLYLNGQPICTTTSAGSNSISGIYAVGDQYQNNENFDGTIDEFMLFNRSLPAAEVYQLYASNLNKYNSSQWYFYVNQSKNSTAGLSGGTYTYQLYAKDGNGNDNTTELRTFIVNNAPVLTNITIVPSPAYIYSNLTVNTTYSDLDMNSGSLTFRWYVNGANVYNYTNTSVSNNTRVSSTLGSGNFTKNQVVIVNVTANDGIADSSVYTANITISNALPSLSVTINSTDNLNRTNGTLSTAWSYSDADGDLQQSNETKWHNNSIEVISLANLTSIGPGNTTKNENWIFSVRVYDGTNWSSWMNSSSLTIQNTVPVSSSVNITSSDSLNRTNGTLTGTWVYSDIDSDTQSANETKWFNNSIEVTSLINYTSVGPGNTTKNQNWTFSVRVYDGTDWSSWTNSSSITIQNTAPTFSHNLTTQTINSSSTLTYDINCSDLDSDTLTYFDNTSLFNINSSTGIIIDTPSHLEHGSYNITITCGDDQDNTTNTFIYTINDIESPTITIEGPLVPSNSNTTLNLTTNEAANCSYGTSFTNYTQMSSTSNLIHLQNLTSLTAGLKRYYFQCNDTSSNSATTNFTFLVTSTTSTESGTNQVNATTNTLVSTKPTTNVNITFNLSSTSSEISVAVAEFNTSPETTSFAIGGSTTNTIKYITIEAPAIINTINKITIKIDYNETEVAAAGIAEADLLVYYYNTTSGNWQQELESAVNTVSNYVEVNVTHLSTFVLGKATVVTAATTTTTTSESSSGPGVGASSGVSIVRPNSVTTIWSLIYQGEEASLVSKELGINKIVFIFNKDVKGTILKVNTVESLPSTVKEFPRTLYRLSKISPTHIKETDLSSAEIQFSVEKSWLVEKQLSAEQVSLYRYTNDQWVELITKKISEDETVVYYQSATPGFSYFLIGKNEYIAPKETVAVPVENQPIPVTEIPELMAQEKKSNLGVILIGVVIILMLVILLILMLGKKKKNRKIKSYVKHNF